MALWICETDQNQTENERSLYLSFAAEEHGSAITNSCGWLCHYTSITVITSYYHPKTYIVSLDYYCASLITLNK